ncbi:hypothetical protein [Acinetobacter sp. Ver3]|uniref:hypothetical protein n=1 Tax=Acinetobacter sp. Ver3 TaxID=466088 RepID=UPI0012DB15F7|nr:hypothetical protein [Acinetobacter sp. Ver3]
MYSNKFEQGYVMSSRLYRYEVYPFLSDAARNVYAELENRINGHNKESDFVSYSQLQGGDLEGSRKMGRTTVSNALQELIKLGVITVTANGKQGMKSYRLNEVSLKDQFTNKTSPTTRLVRKQDHTSTASEPVTSPVTGHTIDRSIESLEEDNNKKFTAQSRALNFVEYHPQDRTAISFKDLCEKYPAVVDFHDQAKISYPNHSSDRIFENLKAMAQWSLDKSNHTPQKWMSIWLTTFMKNLRTDAEEQAYQQRQNKPAQQKSNTAQKPQSRFGHFLQPNQQQNEIRDIEGESRNV